MSTDTMADRLVEIDQKDWQNLKNLYKPDGSKSYIAFTAIDNYIRWFQQNPSFKTIKFFCLNGDFSDGTFVVTERYVAYADTLNASHENLRKLLQLLDYSRGYFFLSERPEIAPTMIEAIQQINVELAFVATTVLYVIPKEDALKFDVQVPEGITLRQITDNGDIEKVNSVWPHRNPTSLEYIQNIAKYNVNVGAYKEDGTLVAWLFRLPSGLLGVLQTDENYLGRGYASLVLKYVSKKIAEMGQDVYAGVVEDNTPSHKLFKKHGAKSVCEVRWITTKINWTPLADD